jgi:hypothetical protein
VRALLRRLALRKNIGISISDREVAVSEVASTPLGRVEVVLDRIALEDDGLARALGRLMTRHFSRKDLARARVSVGLPAMNLFFWTGSIPAKLIDATPETQLHEVLQSPSLNIEDLTIDLIKLKIGQQSLTSIVACKKKYLSAVLTALEASGINLSRAEPAPCALLRDAAKRLGAPRKSTTIVRVFLGAEQGLAVLTAGADRPLLWREFDLSAGDEAAAILTSVSALGNLGRLSKLETKVDAVLIHGRPDLGPLTETGAALTLQGLKMLRHDLPGLDNGAVALGLADGPGQGTVGFNLVRSLGRGVSFFELFPLGQVLFQVAILIAVTLFLQTKTSNARAAVRTARAADVKFTWAAKLDTEKLLAEKKELDQRAEALRKFLDTRILWTTYAHDIADRLAPEIALSSFQGASDLDAIGGKPGKIKRQLLLKLEAPIPKTGTMPREIDAFLQTLRKDPLLKRDFPEIEMGDLTFSQGTPGQPVAAFSVTCQPVTRVAPPKAPASAAKKKAK